MLVKCLACDAENDGLSTGGFCENCGKKLPASALTKTRRVLGGDDPESAAAEKTFVPPKNRIVSEALWAATVVYLVAGGLFLILGQMLFTQPGPESFAPHVLSWTVLPALILGALGFVARLVPMPALWLAVGVGLLLMPVTFVLHPRLAGGWVLVDAALFALLLRAVWLGLAPEKRVVG